LIKSRTANGAPSHCRPKRFFCRSDEVVALNAGVRHRVRPRKALAGQSGPRLDMEESQKTRAAVSAKVTLLSSIIATGPPGAVQERQRVPLIRICGEIVPFDAVTLGRFYSDGPSAGPRLAPWQACLVGIGPQPFLVSGRLRALPLTSSGNPVITVAWAARSYPRIGSSPPPAGVHGRLVVLAGWFCHYFCLLPSKLGPVAADDHRTITGLILYSWFGRFYPFRSSQSLRRAHSAARRHQEGPPPGRGTQELGHRNRDLLVRSSPFRLADQTPATGASTANNVAPSTGRIQAFCAKCAEPHHACSRVKAISLRRPVEQAAGQPVNPDLRGHEPLDGGPHRPSPADLVSNFSPWFFSEPRTNAAQVRCPGQCPEAGHGSVGAGPFGRFRGPT